MINSLCRKIFMNPIQKAYLSTLSENIASLQKDAITKIKNGKNICIVGEPTPAINNTLYAALIQYLTSNHPEPIIKDNATIDSFTQENLFKPVEKAYDNFIKNYQKDTPKGAIVISPSIDVAMQKYAICRKLDSQNKLKMTRMHSALQLYAPNINEVCLVK